jgi:hypothetical protein
MSFHPVFKAIAGLTLAFSVIPPASAQLANCQAPRSNEFILLVVTRTPEAQSRVRSVISRDADLSVCNYFGETVTRIGGYQDADTANSWVNYLNDTLRLQSFVAVPSGGQVAALPQGSPQSQIAPQEIDVRGDLPPERNLEPPREMLAAVGFNPQPLGEGFAVIVNHYNRPEVAAQMQQVLNRNIGLVSFEQRPFLLAVHTSDRTIADQIMQALNDRGFTAMLVSSRRLTLLAPAVQTDAAIGRQ